MQTLIDAADTGFASTTGFHISELVNWSVTNLFQLFIGAVVALLYNLRYVIITLIIIAVVLYAMRRALGVHKV